MRFWSAWAGIVIVGKVSGPYAEIYTRYAFGERVAEFVSTRRQLTLAQKWVVALTGLTLALGLTNLGRAVIGLHYLARLPDLPTTTPLTYLAATGGFWGIVFVVCAIGLSCFRDWGRWATLAAVTLYQANVWVNHLLFDVSDYARRTTPRNLVLTAILLLVFWGSLSLPPLRRVFEGNDERH